MDIGWNFRREHLPLEQRSHYVITDGGDQPNVVPRHGLGLVLLPPDDVSEDQGAVGDRRRHGQGRGDDDRHRAAADRACSARAWPQHFNKAVAETTWANIQKVGMPTVERGRPDARQGAAEGARRARAGALERRSPNELQGPVDGQPRRRLGRHRRHLVERADGHAALSRRTFPACRATTGPTRSRWPRRSRTRARPPAPRCRR